MEQYRHVITEAVVEDTEGNLVGRIRLVRTDQRDTGRYHWHAGSSQGWCATYDDAKAALVVALTTIAG